MGLTTFKMGRVFKLDDDKAKELIKEVGICWRRSRGKQPQSLHESLDATGTDLSNQAGAKLLNIVGLTLLFSPTTSFFLFNEV